MFQERELFLQSLNEFVSSCKNKFTSVLSEVEWTKESIYLASKNEKNSCKDEKNGNSQLSGRDSANSYEDCKTSICKSQVSNNNGNLLQLISFTYEKYPFKRFSKETVGSDGLYNNIMASFNQPQTSSKQDEKSRAEILAEMLKMERDAKRRRINYKNRVHTKNKSHIEIIREVLAEQMATLSENSEAISSLKLPEEDHSRKTLGSDLIEVHIREGNPHTSWKSIISGKSPETNVRERRERKSFNEKDGKYGYSNGKSYRDRERDNRRKEGYREGGSKYLDHESSQTHRKSRGDEEDHYYERRNEDSRLKNYDREYNRSRVDKSHDNKKKIKPRESAGYGKCRDSSEHTYQESSRKKHQRVHSNSPQRKSKKHKSSR